MEVDKVQHLLKMYDEARNDIWAVVVTSKIRNYIHKKKNPFPWLPSIAISTWHGQLILPKRKQLGDTHTNNNCLRGPVAVTVRRVTSKDISGLPFIVCGIVLHPHGHTGDSSSVLPEWQK